MFSLIIYCLSVELFQMRVYDLVCKALSFLHLNQILNRSYILFLASWKESSSDVYWHLEIMYSFGLQLIIPISLCHGYKGSYKIESSSIWGKLWYSIVKTLEGLSCYCFFFLPDACLAMVITRLKYSQEFSLVTAALLRVILGSWWSQNF